MTAYHIIKSGTVEDYAFVGSLIRVVVPKDQHHYQGIRELVFEVQRRVEFNGVIHLYTRVDKKLPSDDHFITVRATTPVDVLVESLEDEPSTLGTVVTARENPGDRPNFFTRSRSQEAAWVYDEKDNTFYTWSFLRRNFPLIQLYSSPVKHD